MVASERAFQPSIRGAERGAGGLEGAAQEPGAEVLLLPQQFVSSRILCSTGSLPTQALAVR